MLCPRCETSSLIELDRQGLTIDRCERCRGVWLDRGELEKLMAREREGEGGERRFEASEANEAPRRYRRADSDDGDDRHHHGKRRSWWDLFD